jgi:hypothetical protein
MRRSLALSAALLALAPAAEAATPITIRTSDGLVTRIGSVRTAGGPNAGKLSHVIRAWGRPSSRRSFGRGTGCTVRWKRLGFTGTFVNLGGGGSACRADLGALQTAVVRGRRFRTTGGVGVGSPTSEVRAKHPGARFVNGSWWIASAVLPYGDGSRTPTVRAIPRRGAVQSLRLWVGAAGE